MTKISFSFCSFSDKHLNRFFGRPTVEQRLTFTMQSAMMTKNALRAGATAKTTGTRGRASVRVFATSRVDRCSKSEVMVAPSILSANFARLGEQVRAVYWRARATRIATCHMSLVFPPVLRRIAVYFTSLPWD